MIHALPELGEPEYIKATQKACRLTSFPKEIFMDSPAELLEVELKDIFNAEKQLLKALPKMAKKASTPSLKAAFTTHLKETEGHVARLLRRCDRGDGLRREHVRSNSLGRIGSHFMHQFFSRSGRGRDGFHRTSRKDASQLG